MATIKKSKKKRIIIPICIVLVLAIIGGSIGIYANSKKVPQVVLYSIGTDTIVENVSATGEVAAGAAREYSIGTVANCREVFVKVGDTVKKGDTLATFDTSELDAQVVSLQESYNTSKTSYENALASQKRAKKQLKAVNKQIPKLEKEVKRLEKQLSTTSTTKAPTSRTTTTTTTTTTATTTTATTTTTTAKTTTKKTYPSGMDGVIAALTDLSSTFINLTNDVEQTNAITRVVMQSVATEISKGNYSPEAISKVVGDAMSDAIRKGIIDETKLIIDSGVAVEMVQEAVKAVDWAAIGSSIAQDNNVQYASVELQLTSLYAQRELFSASADGTIVSTQKQAMNATKSALDTLKKTQEELRTGWIASIDGTVTECNIAKGDQTTALQTGIKIENLNSLVAKISLGEYDVHKVKVGMPATIKSAYGMYTGEIVSIAPTATGKSSGSVLDSVGSMAGISGLSSLTSSGAGVECIVSINEPDSNIIAGFDADVEIKTGTYDSVPTVPIESIILEKDGTYVYKYNEADETVTKTKIETGATSDTSYEIISGLSIGDRIVATPASDYEEESFKVKVAAKD